MTSSSKTATFPVQGMTCAACANTVERILQNKDGVEEASVNFAAHKATIKYSSGIKEQDLKSALQELGYDLDLDANRKSQQEQKKAQYQKMLRGTIWSFVFSFPVFTIGMFFPSWEPGSMVSALLSVPVLFIWGFHFYRNAWKQFRHGLVNMDTLVALSTGIAFGFSLFNTFYPGFWIQRGMEPHVYYEAAVLIVSFVSLGKTLEERAKVATSRALGQLLDLQNPQVYRVLDDGKQEIIDIEELQPGDIVRVKPGESIAIDGQVIDGFSQVDESMLSGEFMPINKTKDDLVYAGTINQTGSLLVRTQKLAGETLLAQIIQRVEEAQGSKAPIQRLVDQIAKIFVPGVILIATITFLYWSIWGGEEAIFTAIYTSVAVLVIACPCALGLATPTAIMVGIGKGATNNILIRDAESLEIAPKVNAIVLDKTGTLSQSKARVIESYWREVDQDSALLLALQQLSQHPIANALVLHLNSGQVNLPQLDNFELVEGKGIKARDESGKLWASGNDRFLRDFDLSVSPEWLKRTKHAESQGFTVIYFFNEKELLAQFIIGDPLKEGSMEAVNTLKQKGVELHILTGDRTEVAAFWAKQLGIEHFQAEVLPHEKGDYIQKLQASGKKVAMVGDGINDSEALAKADLSIAMGHGSDIAIEAAQITLLTSDLRAIPKAMKLSHQTVGGIRQNLFWAFIYNLIGIPLAAGVLYSYNGFLLDPMIAGAAMAFSSVSVVLNSLRLKMQKL